MRLSPVIVALSVALSGGIAGCGNAALHAAERGDNAALRAEIAQKYQKGSLSNQEARDLARAVAVHEISSAKDEAAALARLSESQACARELDGALEERMKKRDGAGAEAALFRLEDGKLGDGDARAWLDDADDRWRAVATRTLHRDRDDDRKRRHAAILDPSPRVRRGAIRAAAEAKDPSDIDLLFDTARVDPDLLLRNEALRSISAILRAPSDRARGRAAELSLRLRDLWTSGDDALKEDVAVAWGLAPVYESGGREALRVAIAGGSGPGAIAAAGVVVRSAPKDTELVGSAQALLARTITDGSRRDRLHAIVVSRLEGAVLEAVRKATQDDDRDIRVPALARMLGSKPDREAAKAELLKIAGYGVKAGAGVAATPSDDPRAIEAAARARLALASAGDLRIQAWVEQDLGAPQPQRKAWAASALAALGREARAAPLLADPDPSIRTRAACTMLVAARH